MNDFVIRSAAGRPLITIRSASRNVEVKVGADPPRAWMTIAPEDARHLAAALLAHADHAERDDRPTVRRVPS